MDPKGNNYPIKISDLTFEMFSGYLNQVKTKWQRKGVKSKMMSAGMYELNKIGLMNLFRMSKHGSPTAGFIWELQLYIGCLKQNVSIDCYFSNITINSKQTLLNYFYFTYMWKRTRRNMATHSAKERRR